LIFILGKSNGWMWLKSGSSPFSYNWIFLRA
jgi:hypothetical protein